MAFNDKITSVGGSSPHRGPYALYEESLTLPDSEGASATTVATTTINASDLDLSDRTFTVVVEVTEVSAGNGGLECALQASPDDSNWVDVDAGGAPVMNLDTTGLNTGIQVLTSVGYEAPYWRINVFSDGTDTEDDAGIKVSFAVKGAGTF